MKKSGIPVANIAEIVTKYTFKLDEIFMQMSRQNLHVSRFYVEHSIQIVRFLHHLNVIIF